MTGPEGKDWACCLIGWYLSTRADRSLRGRREAGALCLRSRQRVSSVQPLVEVPLRIVSGVQQTASFGNPADSRSPVALRSPLARRLPFRGAGDFPPSQYLGRCAGLRTSPRESRDFHTPPFVATDDVNQR